MTQYPGIDEWSINPRYVRFVYIPHGRYDAAARLARSLARRALNDMPITGWAVVLTINIVGTVYDGSIPRLEPVVIGAFTRRLYADLLLGDMQDRALGEQVYRLVPLRGEHHMYTVATINISDEQQGAA